MSIQRVYYFQRSPTMYQNSLATNNGHPRELYIAKAAENCGFSLVVPIISRTPTRLISPPDVKIETTFFQRKFFSTTPYNYPQKQHKKRTSDLSEVPILRLFLKILPPSAPLPASYQIPPDCTLNGIFQSSDTFFLYPSRMFSISFSALAHC